MNEQLCRGLAVQTINWERFLLGFAAHVLWKLGYSLDCY